MAFFAPYAALMAPRSRRDKAMSDDKAINATIRVFTRWKSPSHPAMPANLSAFNGPLPQDKPKCPLPRVKNTDLSYSSHIYRNNSEKKSVGGAGVAEKTSLDSLPHPIMRPNR